MAFLLRRRCDLANTALSGVESQQDDTGAAAELALAQR
jgi:hypothetical protein